MKVKATDGQYSKSEAKRRVDEALRGAFAGPPTPLKAIPKKTGEFRKSAERKRAISASVANLKTASRKKKNPV